MVAGEHSTGFASPTWASAFPLLADALGSARDDVINLTSEAEVERMLSTMANELMDQFTSTQLAVVLPPLAQLTEIPWHELDVRGTNALRRAGIFTADPLIGLSPDDILDLQQIGRGTTRKIVLALCARAVEIARTSPFLEVRAALPPRTPEDPSGQEPAREPLDPLLAQVADDVAILAEWHKLRGVPHALVLCGEGLEGAPTRVVEAWYRLSQLRSTDVPTQGEAAPSEILEGFFEQFDQRERVILSRRTFAEVPETLEALGVELEVTRERIRQIEAKINQRLESALVADEPLLADLTAAVRSRIGIVCPLERLFEGFPGLREPVVNVDQPAWRVIDRLDPLFEIERGWAAAPDVATARELTRARVLEAADSHGLVPLEEVTAALSWDADQTVPLEKWLDEAGFWVLQDRVVATRKTITSVAMAILAIANRPLSLDELVGSFPEDRATSSVRNALALDDQFVRVDVDSWALKEWGMEEYTTIRDLISRRLDLNGGTVQVETLIEELTGKFAIAGSSVRTYAASLPFETVDGVVRLSDGNGAVVKTPARTKGLYRTGESWRVCLTVNEEHFRGSGCLIRTGAARAIGLKPGETRLLSSRQGEQSLYWTGLQPSLGSIRRFLEVDHLGVGDEVFAVFYDDGSFDLQRCNKRVEHDGLAAALALVGSSVSAKDVEAARLAIAEAICSNPLSSWATLIQDARNRGDSDLAELLLTLDMSSRTPEMTKSVDDPVSVDEILGLLK